MKIVKKQEGQGLVEYALLLVLVAIVVIAILAILGDQISVVFARVVAGLNGQDISGTGTEYIISGVDVSVSGVPPFCTVSVGGTVIVFEDGQTAGSGVGVSGSASWSGGSGGSVSGSTNSSGIANLSSASGGGNCSGQATISISGGPSRTVDYGN